MIRIGEEITRALFSAKKKKMLITVPHSTCSPFGLKDFACDHGSLERAEELKKKLESEGFEVDIEICDLIRLEGHDCNRKNRDLNNASVQRTNKAIKSGKYDLLLDVHTFYPSKKMPYILQLKDHAFIDKGSKGFKFPGTLNPGMDRIQVMDAGQKNYNLKLAQERNLPAILIEFQGTNKDYKNDHKLMEILIEYIKHKSNQS